VRPLREGTRDLPVSPRRPASQTQSVALAELRGEAHPADFEIDWVDGGYYALLAIIDTQL